MNKNTQELINNTTKEVIRFLSMDPKPENVEGLVSKSLHWLVIECKRDLLKRNNIPFQSDPDSALERFANNLEVRVSRLEDRFPLNEVSYLDTLQ